MRRRNLSTGAKGLLSKRRLGKTSFSSWIHAPRNGGMGSTAGFRIVQFNGRRTALSRDVKANQREHFVRNRLVASVTAVAVLTGSLALSQGVSTADEASSAEDSATAEEPTADEEAGPLVGLGPMDVISGVAKYVKGLYDDYQTCRANEAVGQPCGASDSDNIRASLDLLKGLDTRVTRLQQDLGARLDELEIGIQETQLLTLQGKFTQIGTSAPRAVAAFSALVDCQAAKLEGQQTCIRYSETGARTSVPVDDGIRQNRSAFLLYTGPANMPQSVPSTVRDYAGRGAMDQFAYAHILWRYAKRKVDRDAGVTQMDFRRSKYAQFVTPSMSNEVNTYLNYYGDLLATYGEVMFLRAIVQRDVAVAAGDTDAATDFQDAADRIRDQIARDIESNSDESVRGIDAWMRLSPLSRGDIIMAGEPGDTAKIYATSGSVPYWAKAMRAMDVAALGQGLNQYGKYSTLKKNQPGAFPQQTDWYTVQARATKLPCDSNAIFAESGKVADVYWLNSVVRPQDRYNDDMVTVNTKVKLLDGPPRWSAVVNSSPSESVAPSAQNKSCGDERGRDYIVTVWAFNRNNPSQPLFQATELQYPMTYDWKPYTFKVSGRTQTFGEGVSIQINNDRTASVYTDVDVNRMVQWPDGYEPTGMPPGY